MVGNPRNSQARQSSSLAELRNAAGVTLDQIESTTKIGKHFLRAIEEGRFDSLPGGLLSRSYVRQYAAAIGCSPEPILRSLEPPIAQPCNCSPSQSRRDSSATWFRFFTLS